jgi:general secretion pathway protein A
MYESFYGLREKPFNLTPDPEYFYLSQNHKNAYDLLRYAVSENKGFVVITGEIGSGKTTLIKYLLNNIEIDVNVGLINNTHHLQKNMLRHICMEFELNVGGNMGSFDLQEIFYGFLLNEYAHRRRVVLIIDEAQNISPESLEEIRLLSNLESEKTHLLQIILVGQPGLKEKLQGEGLEQFTQRVSVTYHLGQMGMKDAIRYIYHRLQKAGVQAQNIFRPEAIKSIYENSKGIPRVINILCDTALVYGFAEEQKEISEKLIMSIVNDRKKSGIYDVIRKVDNDRPSGGLQQGKHAGKDPYENIAIMEQRLKVIEKQLTQLNRGMELMVKNGEISLAVLNKIREASSLSMADSKTWQEEGAMERKKSLKRWASIFGSSRMK